MRRPCANHAIPSWLPLRQARGGAHYPGTSIGITEYYYGDGDHFSGGIAQADLPGICFGEVNFAANLWRLGSGNHSFIYGFEMFRDHDGSSGSFGNTSIQAANTDGANTSIDAGNPNRIVIVCINKTNAHVTAGTDVTHPVAFKHGRGLHADQQQQPAGAVRQSKTVWRWFVTPEGSDAEWLKSRVPGEFKDIRWFKLSERK